MHGKYSTDRIGPRRTLDDDEEQRIADWAMHMAKIGYGRTRRELVMVVKKIMDEDGRRTPFKNNIPGKDWLNAFFSRHPQLSLRTTLQLGKERAIISPDKINRWFADFQTYIETEVKDPDLLRDPSRLYNADESGFSMCSTTGKVVGYRGAPVVYNYGNSNKQQLTVLACASASGHFISPMIVYPGQRFNYEPLEGFEEAHMGRSESGWMDSELFCNWLLTCFIPGIESRCVKKPVILFIDGHSTHLSLEASNICVEHGIELYCLLEHSSHVMQPLDLRLFATLKQHWKAAVRAFQLDNVGEFVNKRNFAKVFKTAWEKSTTIDIAMKGFLEAGLFPLCPEKVTKSVKLQPSLLFASSNNNSLAVSAKNNSAPATVTSAPAASAVVINAPAVSVTVTSTPVASAMVTGALSASVNSTPDVLANNALHTSTVDSAHADNADNAHSASVPGAPCASADSAPSVSSNVTSAPVVSDATALPVAAVAPTTSAPESPFSKYLKYPEIPKTKTTKRKVLPLPKAITGVAYRQLLLEKKEQKEREKREKEMRKEQRARQKILKEETKKQKKIAREKVMLARKKKKIEKDLEKAMGSDSDDSSEKIVPGKCYKCEDQYANEYIECEKCFRRFHIACVENEIIDDVPFECQYC